MGVGCSCQCSRSQEFQTEVLPGDVKFSAVGLAPLDPLLDDPATTLSQQAYEKSPTTCSTLDAPASPSLPLPTQEDSGSSRLGDDDFIPEAERALASVRELCGEGRIFEAAHALQDLEEKLDVTTPSGNSIKDLIAKDTMMVNLRDVHNRMLATLSHINTESLPGRSSAAGQVSDARWVHSRVQEKAISSEFSADIYIRFASGRERDPKGSSTQIIICGLLEAFPCELDRFISVYRETDLYQKEWIADCERSEGTVAGPENLFSAMSHIVNASPLLPVKLQVVSVRNFAVCQQSPFAKLPGGCFCRGPGVLVMDSGVPCDATQFAGFQLPAHLHRAVRLTGMSMILYFTPRSDKPGCCDVFAFGKTGVPVPQFLVPLSLLKRFLSHHFLSVFVAIKTHILDKWDKLDYGQRMEASPTFYRSARHP